MYRKQNILCLKLGSDEYGGASYLEGLPHFNNHREVMICDLYFQASCGSAQNFSSHRGCNYTLFQTIVSSKMLFYSIISSYPEWSTDQSTKGPLPNTNMIGACWINQGSHQWWAISHGNWETFLKQEKVMKVMVWMEDVDSPLEKSALLAQQCLLNPECPLWYGGSRICEISKRSKVMKSKYCLIEVANLKLYINEQ